jgi:hypothetical protein
MSTGRTIMLRRTALHMVSLVAAGALLGWPATPAAGDNPAPVTDDEAAEIAVGAYLYASSPQARQALEKAPAAGKKRIVEQMRRLVTAVRCDFTNRATFFGSGRA